MNYLEKYIKDDNIIKILDNNNLILLRNNKKCDEIINTILCNSLKLDELFNNLQFIDIFLNCNLFKCFKSIQRISYPSSINIISRAINNNISPNKVANLFKLFDISVQKKIINSNILNDNYIYAILESGVSNDVIKSIFNNYNINLSISKLNLNNLFKIVKRSNIISLRKNDSNYIQFPNYTVDDSFLNKLWVENDIFSLRFLVNDIQYCMDVSKINEFIKKKEEEIIYSYNDEYILEEFNYLILLIKKYHDSSNSCEIEKKIYDYIKYLSEKNIYVDNYIVSFNSDVNDIIKYFKLQTQKKVSDAIIDYHFEENYHNVIIDIKEILNFERNGNIKISNDNLKFYSLIVNIDKLSYEEKIQLHECLKNINIKEILYDDIRYCKNVMARNILYNSLNSNTLFSFYDNDLSNKYGIPVYNLTGREFMGIVKTGRNLNNEYPGGHSFSLIGENHINVFGDIKKGNTFFYDSSTINERQFVHVFPSDSFSYFEFNEQFDFATNRIYKLFSPRELLNMTSNYNEILLLERGIKHTDFDNDIPIISKLGLYCLDEIKNIDIETAKNNNVGIIYINSKEHNKFFQNKKLNNHFFDNDIYLHNMVDFSNFESSRIKI